MSSTGMSSVIKPSQDPMRNTTNSSKSYQRPTQDKFSKTEWMQPKWNDKPISEIKQVEDNISKMKLSSTQDNFRQTISKGSGVTGGSSLNRKLKQKKQSSKIYYE